MSARRPFPGFRVRPARAADAGLLADALPDVFDGAVDAARARACLGAPGYRMFVAIGEGRVIGQVRGFIQRQPDDDAWLYVDNLGVSEDWKRRGVASALLERLTDWGAGQGARLVWLGSEPDNDEAAGFYAAAGFTAEPMLLWSKPLGPG